MIFLCFFFLFVEASSDNVSPAIDIHSHPHAAPPLLITPSLSMSPSISHPHLKGEMIAGSPHGVYGSYNDLQFEGVDFGELVDQLAETESLSEQADIIHYLYLKKYGPPPFFVLTCAI